MYKLVTVGGTFDYLHEGHKTIFRKAFEISERVVVGVTCQKFPLRWFNNKGCTFIIGFVERRRSVERFLRAEGYGKRGEIREIKDMFGPLRKETEIEAIVVTRQTRENAERINKWRKAQGLNELDIVEVGMVLAENKKPISSRRIRAGEINREGVVYGMHKLWGRLPQELREELRKPLGKIIRGGKWEVGGEISEVGSGIDDVLKNSARAKKIKESEPSQTLSKNQDISLQKSKSLTSHISPLIVTIGDVSTKKLIDAGIKPELVVFDLKVRRKKVFTAPEDIGIDEDYQLLRIKNPSGQVTEELYTFFSHLDNHVDAEVRKIRPGNGWKIMRGGIEGRGRKARKRRVDVEVKPQKKVAVWVEGEEDLAALPAILFAPLGSLVVYGQPPIPVFKATLSNSLKASLSREQRLVIVEVTEERKEYVFGILQRFERP